MADNLLQWHGGLVDPTLTKATISAEAKATGVAIEAVKKSLKELQDTGISSEYIEEAILEYLTNNPIEGVTNRELEQAVEAALQEAKDSGEFDGKDGEPGKDGQSGVIVSNTEPTDPDVTVWVNPNAHVVDEDEVVDLGPIYEELSSLKDTKADKGEITYTVGDNISLVAGRVNGTTGVVSGAITYFAHVVIDDLVEGATITWTPPEAGNGYGYGMAWYDANDVYVSGISITSNDAEKENTFTAPKNAVRARLGGNVNYISVTPYNVFVVRNYEHTLAGAEKRLDELENAPKPHVLAVNGLVKSIAHRGMMNDAPENTLPAFKLAKLAGFECVECDVSFTSDGVAVLLHDETIDRTSNGTGNIADMTYAQVSQYDFGSWKSEEFAGTKIPTFEEFIVFCKRIGLKPYVEIKVSQSPTSEQMLGLVNTVKRYGMIENTTWMSTSSTLLDHVKTHSPAARLGVVANAVTDGHITWAKGVKAEGVDAFIMALYNQLTTDTIEECADEDIPVEAWGIYTVEQTTALDPYISGVSSENIIMGLAWYNSAVN